MAGPINSRLQDPPSLRILCPSEPHSLDADSGSPTTLAELEHTNALHGYLDYLCLVPYEDTSTRLDCGGKAPIRSLDANCGRLSTLIR